MDKIFTLVRGENLESLVTLAPNRNLTPKIAGEGLYGVKSIKDAIDLAKRGYYGDVIVYGVNNGSPIKDFGDLNMSNVNDIRSFQGNAGWESKMEGNVVRINPTEFKPLKYSTDFGKSWNSVSDLLWQHQNDRMNESKTKKNRIRLTESQLHRIIKESIKNALNEDVNYGVNNCGEEEIEQWYYNLMSNERTKGYLMANMYDYIINHHGFEGLMEVLKTTDNDYIDVNKNKIV